METVTIDLTKVKAGFWDRLSTIAQDDEVTIKEFLIEMRSQLLVMDELVNGGNDGK